MLVLLSCGRQQNNNNNNNVQPGEGLKYARGYSIADKGNYFRVEVYNPWDNYKILRTYVIADSSSKVVVPGDITYLRLPLEKGVFLSSTYIGMLSMLHSEDFISACTSANWVFDSVIYRKYKQGDIINLGNGLGINTEAIIGLSPDLVMKYIYQAPDASDDIIASSGIPIVYNIEFMEPHPLGRAEWIKLIGLLTGKKDLADSIFSEIEKNYLHYCSMANKAPKGPKPKVLVGNTYKGVWYAAGGKSFVAKLIGDAGGDYYWSADSSTGGLPISFEGAMQKQKDDDIWLNANASSLAELAATEPRSINFKAFREGNVYHYNKRKNPEGGLDYYESGVIRPDLLLRDLILILHPELFGDSEQTLYWQKLK